MAAVGSRLAEVRKIVYSSAHPEGIKLVSVPGATDESGGAANRVLCHVACAGLNPVDAKGLVGDKLPEWLSGVGRTAIEGRVVGFDFSGTVVSAPATSPFKAGDAIWGTAPPLVGTFAEEISVPLDQIAPKPPSLTFSEAAALPLVGLTALQSLKHDNGLCEGQHLLLIGASGGVGHVACQVAKALGARITAICSDRNRELVMSLGADRVVDYSQGDASTLQGLRAAVNYLGPFNLCLDTVSSLEAKDDNSYQSLVGYGAPPGSQDRLLRGKYVKIGGRPYDWVRAGLKRTVGLNLFSAHKELFWFFETPSACVNCFEWRAFKRSSLSAEALGELEEMVEAGKLKPKVSREIDLQEEEVREAFRRLHERRLVGKQVLRIDPDLP